MTMFLIVVPLQKWSGWKWERSCRQKQNLTTSVGFWSCLKWRKAMEGSTCVKPKTRLETPFTTLTWWWKVRLMHLCVGASVFGACIDSSSRRAAKVVDGASSGPAVRGRVRCSHQVLGQWKTATTHNMEEKRRAFHRWVGIIPAALCPVATLGQWTLQCTSAPSPTHTASKFNLRAIEQCSDKFCFLN